MKKTLLLILLLLAVPMLAVAQVAPAQLWTWKGGYIFPLFKTDKVGTSTTDFFVRNINIFGTSTVANGIFTNLNTNFLTATSATIGTANIFTANITGFAISPLIVGGTATTTIKSDGATSTFGGGIYAPSAQIGTLTGYIKGLSGIFSGQTGVPYTDLTSVPPTFNATMGNPTASIGLTAINGSATTAMRSDGAPALSVGIAPTWTGIHTFSNATYSALFTGGNVGIGTTSPGYRLSVAGEINMQTSGFMRINGTALLGHSSSGLRVGTTNTGNAGDLTFYAGGDPLAIARMFIESDNGNVGIGTVSPQSTLHIPDGKYAQLEDNNAGAPPAANCDAAAELGRISIDTTNNRLYICMGATRLWDFVSLTD